jgi:hypothetical protein
MRNGYAYEHRIVAEKKLGRLLRGGEIPHHINGNKTDNRPENIVVLQSLGRHRAEHRKPGSRLRKPGAPNPIVSCACGCGQRFARFDRSGFGRPRRFVRGHNTTETAPRILCACGCGTTIKRFNSKRHEVKYAPWHKPKPENPTIVCACGCGTEFPKYDQYRRERRFVSGHNRNK